MPQGMGRGQNSQCPWQPQAAKARLVLVHLTETVPLLLSLCFLKLLYFSFLFFPHANESTDDRDKKTSHKAQATQELKQSAQHPGSRTVGPQTLHRVHQAYSTSLRVISSNVLEEAIVACNLNATFHT